jgi:hypothetical protein
MNSYQRIVNSIDEQELPLLPLIRNVQYKYFFEPDGEYKSVVEYGGFEVFKKNRNVCNRDKSIHVIYCYYGRQAHRFNELNGDFADMIKTGESIVFVFNSKKVNCINAVYPFDTGDYLKGRCPRTTPLSREADTKKLDDATDEERAKLDNYVLGNNIFSASKFVEALYGSNENYLSLHIENNFTEIQDYVEFVNFVKDRKSADENPIDRAATIEVMIGSDILFKDSLEAIIVPKRRAGKIEKYLSALSNIKIIPFNARTDKYINANHYNNDLHSELMEYYKRIKDKIFISDYKGKD